MFRMFTIAHVDQRGRTDWMYLLLVGQGARESQKNANTLGVLQ